MKPRLLKLVLFELVALGPRVVVVVLRPAEAVVVAAVELRPVLQSES